MKRAIQAAGLLLVAAALAFCEQRGGGKAAPAPRPNAGRMPAGPRVGAAKPPARITNPANPISRLYRATPEQRERVLEKLPPAAQERARRNLQWFDSLSPEQQKMVIEQGERLASLPPERQQQFQQSFREFQRLPQDRKLAVRMALNRLRVMTEERRAEVLASEQFRNRFAPEEQKMIVDLCEVMGPAR